MRYLFIAALLLTGLGLSSCDSHMPSEMGKEEIEIPLMVETAGKEKVCVSEACYAPVETVLDHVFYLQGTALRKKLWIEVYSAGFYLPQATESAEEEHGVPKGAKLMILEYHRDIPKQKIVESIINQVGANPYVDQASVRERFDQLTAAFDEPEKGSRYLFLYEPDKGTSLIHKGKTEITVPGDDFAFAFYAIWLREGNEMRSKLLA